MASAAARPASCRAARTSSGRPGAGDSSTTFWCRRWIEQSRSPSTSTPSVVPTTWTSTCRPCSTYGSTNTVPSPNADAASADAFSISPGRSARRAHDPHAAAATSGGRLHQERQVGLGRLGRRFQHRHPGGGHQLLGLDLGAHLLDRLRRRPDPDEPGGDDGAGEVGVLGEESVARVDRVGTRAERGVDQQVGAQVGVGRSVAGQPDGKLGLGDVRQRRVGVGVHGDGLDAETPAGPEHARRDLRAVGDEQASDHVRNTP